MIWVNIIALIILFFSFIGGFKEGAIRNLFSLIALLIAVPAVGVSYHLLANLLSFLPGENWENFVGFFITMGLIMFLLVFVLLIPRKLFQTIWHKGGFHRLIGGILNLFGTAVSLVVLTLVIGAYPIFGWLEQVVTDSGVLTWLVSNLGFVSAMLPFA